MAQFSKRPKANAGAAVVTSRTAPGLGTTAGGPGPDFPAAGASGGGAPAGDAPRAG